MSSLGLLEGVGLSPVAGSLNSLPSDKILEIPEKKKQLHLTILTNKVRKKETNERMHGRNIRFGQDSNQ